MKPLLSIVIGHCAPAQFRQWQMTNVIWKMDNETGRRDEDERRYPGIESLQPFKAGEGVVDCFRLPAGRLFPDACSAQQGGGRVDSGRQARQVRCDRRASGRLSLQPREEGRRALAPGLGGQGRRQRDELPLGLSHRRGGADLRDESGRARRKDLHDLRNPEHSRGSQSAGRSDARTRVEFGDHRHLCVPFAAGDLHGRVGGARPQLLFGARADRFSRMDASRLVVAPGRRLSYRARIRFVGKHAGGRMAMMIPKKRWGKRWARRALISLGLLAVGCAALFFALPALLIEPASVEKSDVILYGAISKHSAADKYVIDLYRRGMARKIVCVGSQVSWELYPGDYVRESLVSQGVRAEDVVSLRLPLAPCGGAETPGVVKFVKDHGWKSALYVTHPEDSRYTDYLARRFFEREGIALAVSYSPEDREELTRSWWRTHWKAQRMLGEAMIIALDRFYSECR